MLAVQSQQPGPRLGAPHPPPTPAYIAHMEGKVHGLGLEALHRPSQQDQGVAVVAGHAVEGETVGDVGVLHISHHAEPEQGPARRRPWRPPGGWPQALHHPRHCPNPQTMRSVKPPAGKIPGQPSLARGTRWACSCRVAAGCLKRFGHRADRSNAINLQGTLVSGKTNATTLLRRVKVRRRAMGSGAQSGKVSGPGRPGVPALNSGGSFCPGTPMRARARERSRRGCTHADPVDPLTCVCPEPRDSLQ